jgi:hypothetical protein
MDRLQSRRNPLGNRDFNDWPVNLLHRWEASKFGGCIKQCLPFCGAESRLFPGAEALRLLWRLRKAAKRHGEGKFTALEALPLIQSLPRVPCALAPICSQAMLELWAD